jgi:hypothetical protein
MAAAGLLLGAGNSVQLTGFCFILALVTQLLRFSCFRPMILGRVRDSGQWRAKVVPRQLVAGTVCGLRAETKPVAVGDHVGAERRAALAGCLRRS